MVILGAGFGGLSAAKALRNAPCDVVVIDRRNYHLFQPLLYQVATAALSPAEIASPIRSILSRQKNARVLMARVTGIDAQRKLVQLEHGRDEPFDYLIVATGARHAYFGHDDWAKCAPGLKKIEDATDIRRRILLAFERAETTDDADERKALLTFVVIGGGATGVEMAGAIAEVAHWALADEFRVIDPTQARIILVEAGRACCRPFRPISRSMRARRWRSWGSKCISAARSSSATTAASSMAASGWRRAPSSGAPACKPRPPPSGWTRTRTAPGACWWPRT